MPAKVVKLAVQNAGRQRPDGIIYVYFIYIMLKFSGGGKSKNITFVKRTAVGNPFSAPAHL